MNKQDRLKKFTDAAKAGEKKDSPDAKPDNATGLKPQHTQDVPNNSKNKPTPRDGKPSDKKK